MVSAVIAKIISMQQSLTVSENEIAQYVIHNAEAVVSSTITAVARNTNTSEASINRFCKKIGFKGFNSFKVALAQENFYNSMQQSADNMPDGLISTVSRDYRQMLMNTTAMLDEGQVLQAADAVARAPHIFIFSIPTTAFVARELEFKLSMVGLYAKAVSENGEVRICTNCVGREDLVIAIAPTLLVRDLYPALTACKEKGAQILSITSFDSPKLAALVDYKFIISDRLTAQNSAALSNNAMFLYVTDVLYCAMLERDRTLKQRRLSSDSMLSSQQAMDSYYLEF